MLPRTPASCRRSREGGYALWALLAASGCAHQVAWQIQPVPSTPLPSLQVAVIAEDRGCKEVADSLVDSLAARPGVEVNPDAAVQLRVSDCRYEVLATVDVEVSEMSVIAADYPEQVERRRYLVDGWALASMTVVAPAQEPRDLEVSAERHDRTAWSSAPRDPARHELDDALTRDLAWALADHVAPLPETLRRRLYADPEPGTARALHNRAVEAEKVGNLNLALQLARDAYAADPSAERMRYIEALQAHASRVGYALAP